MCLSRLRRHSLDLEWKWRPGNLSEELLSPHWFQMPVYLACAITLFLSPQEFQLPTFHAGWCSSAVTLLHLPQWFQLPVYFACAVTSLSSGVSTANLSCWLVLIRCNLSPQGFQLPFFRVHGYFSAVRQFVFQQQFEQHAWHDPSPSAFSIFHSFVPLSLQHVKLCIVSVASPIFLLLHVL